MSNLQSDPGQVRLLRFFEDSYLPLRLRCASPRTVTLYRSTLKYYARFLGRPPVLADLTDQTASKFLYWLKTERSLAPASINKERDNLLAMWRYASRKRLVDTFPDVEAEVEQEVMPEAWTEEEMKQIYYQFKRLKRNVGTVPESVYWPTLVMVNWDTGERISAIMSATRNDLRKNWIVFRAETRKGRKTYKTFMLGNDTVAALHDLLEYHDDDLLFPWPKSRTYLWDRYGTLLARAGLPNNCRCKFHKIRRSTASHLKANGGDPTDALGHSSSKITQRYLDPRIVGGTQPKDLLFRLADPEFKPNQLDVRASDRKLRRPGG